jgi:hypothetical protein
MFFAKIVIVLMVGRARAVNENIGYFAILQHPFHTSVGNGRTASKRKLQALGIGVTPGEGNNLQAISFLTLDK